MTKTYLDLLTMAKEGRELPQKELHAIRAKLVTAAGEEDPYTLLNILGTAGDLESLPLVERYLDFESEDPENDGMLRRLALQIIGRQWARPEVFGVAEKKMTTDPDKYVRAAAATVVGFLGGRFPALTGRAAKNLLCIIEDQGLDDYTRESAYYGLLELLKIPPQKWPSSDWGIKSGSMDPTLLQEARSLSSS